MVYIKENIILLEKDNIVTAKEKLRSSKKKKIKNKLKLR